LKEIIIVQNVIPFYKAFNTGVSKVTSEFFVQVDSDMILDETCLEDLRACMSQDVGMVLGSLKANTSRCLRSRKTAIRLS